MNLSNRLLLDLKNLKVKAHRRHKKTESRNIIVTLFNWQVLYYIKDPENDIKHAPTNVWSYVKKSSGYPSTISYVVKELIT